MNLSQLHQTGKEELTIAAAVKSTAQASGAAKTDGTVVAFGQIPNAALVNNDEPSFNANKQVNSK
jgi:hypothetical protein